MAQSSAAEKTRSTARRKPSSKTRSTSKSAKSKKRITESSGGTPGLNPENRRTLGFLAAFAASGFTMLALLSYTPADPAFSRRSSVEEVANWSGRSGAMLADMLYQLLGYSAWMVLGLTVWMVLRFLRKPSARFSKLAAGVAFTWLLSTFLGMLFYPDVDGAFPAGGALGGRTAEWMLLHVGTVGAYVVVTAVAMGMATIVFGIDWESLAGQGVEAVEGRTPDMQEAFGVAARGAWARGGAALSRVLSAPKALLTARRAAETWAEEDELEEWTSEEAEEGRTPGMSVGAISIDRVQEPCVGPLSAALSDRTHTALSVDFADDRDVPTAWADRELVEVQVDPTITESNPTPVMNQVEVEPDSQWDDLLDAPDPPALVQEAPVVAPTPQARVVASVSEDFGLDESFEDEDELLDAPEPQAVASQVVAPAPASVAPRAATRAEAPALSAAIEPGNLVSGGDEDSGDLIQWPTDPNAHFELPHISLLDTHDRSVGELDEVALRQMADALVEKLANFNIKGEVTAIRPGPVITIFEYLPAPGIKVSRIAGLTDDIAMAMRALRVRIVAPIPGKGVVGIELPNKKRQTVWYRDIMASSEFRDQKWTLPMCLGKTPTGQPAIADLAKMPHLLVGGTTGSGKSVGVNAMLMTMLFYKTPEELRMILIDPKMLEFELYNDIPHLLHPVVTEPKLAAAALQWACKEMDDRYRILARWGTRNIASFNKKVDRELESWDASKARRYKPRNWPEGQEYRPEKFPYIVIVIDELADLMMVASKEVEESIVRLAQKARACGIHLIVATQRPSVDVITGLIKANMPSRIAFQVRSKTDGRTILDQNGAETLLGKGDMLYLPPGVSGLQRLHGAFVADEEVQRVTDYLRDQGEPSYDAEIRVADEAAPGDFAEEEYDEFYDMAVQLVCEQGKASTSMIQRHLRIGYNRAARIIDMMEAEGVVGPADGARPREVLAQRIEA